MQLDTLLTNPHRADPGDKFVAAFADATFSAALRSLLRACNLKCVNFFELSF
jgi:hypothetical protein